MTRQILSRYLLLVLLFGTVGCAYFMSGEWKDDPKNWSRAFRSAKPEDAVVLHSYYWRSPHWSYEFRYYFEIEKHDDLQEQLLTENRLKNVQGELAQELHRSVLSDAPEWFVPKETEGYKVYIYETEPESNFVMFIDLETNNMFLADYQI